MLSAEVSTRSRAAGGSRVWVWATGTALVGALAAYAVGARVDGPLLVAGPREVTPVPVGAVVLATLVGAAAAAGLVRLSRRTRRPRRSYLLLVGLGLLVSAVPPLQGATATSTAAWLLVLHAVVAGVLVPAGWRQLLSKRSR